MPSPSVRIACCLCGKTIPKRDEVNALDEEWRRRFPQMNGILACNSCVLHQDHYWSCETAEGYTEGHIPAASDGPCIDAWSHIQGRGTHLGMIQSYPEAGARQGASDYLRHALQRPGIDPEAARRFHDALAKYAADT